MPLVMLKCPNCGAELNVENNQNSFFCQYCGTRIENVAQKVEVTQNINQNINMNVKVDHSNEPNLIINYSSVHPRVVMVVRIVSTGQKAVYMNNQTFTYHLAPGKQVIVLKIGKVNYKRVVYITPENGPVVINASYVGRAQIMIDQPPYSTDMPNAANVPAGPKMSGLAIAAFVLSLTCYGSILGLIMGIVDLIIGKKDKGHGMAIAAIAIGTVMTIIFFSAVVPSMTKGA